MHCTHIVYKYKLHRKKCNEFTGHICDLLSAHIMCALKNLEYCSFYKFTLYIKLLVTCRFCLLLKFMAVFLFYIKVYILSNNSMFFTAVSHLHIAYLFMIKRQLQNEFENIIFATHILKTQSYAERKGTFSNSKINEI